MGSSSNEMLKLSYGKTAVDNPGSYDNDENTSKTLQYVDGKIVLRIGAPTLAAAAMSFFAILTIVQKKR
jgi:hypothetical protein